MSFLPRRLANSDYYLQTNPTQRVPQIRDIRVKWKDQFGHRYAPALESGELWHDVIQDFLTGYDQKTCTVFWVVPNNNKSQSNKEKGEEEAKIPEIGTQVVLTSVVALDPKQQQQHEQEKQLEFTAATSFIYANVACTTRGRRRTAYIILEQPATKKKA
jgi:hypothetical protein